MCKNCSEARWTRKNKVRKGEFQKVIAMKSTTMNCFKGHIVSVFVVFLVGCSASLVPATAIRLLSASKFALTSLAYLSLSFPLGNIGSAIEAITKNPEAITCSLDTQQTDDNHGSCQQLDQVVRIRAGKLLTIKQDWGGSASTGAAVWNGANMAGWYMENVIGKEKMSGSSVLELGAGVGFTSLIANALGSSEVVITDGNSDVLKIADQNIKTNSPESDISNIRTAQLRWNTDDQIPFKNNHDGRPWDYIIAADVTYLKKNRFDLLTSIAYLSGPKTVTMISMEPRNVGEVEDVLAIAEAQGLSWKEKELPVDKVKSQCNLMCARMFVLTKNPN